MKPVYFTRWFQKKERKCLQLNIEYSSSYQFNGLTYMKNIIILIISVLFSEFLLAQKPTLTDTSYKHWSWVLNGNISPNGKYADYMVTSDYQRFSLVLVATDKSWQKTLPGSHSAVYSKCGRDAYTITGGKLIRIQLASDIVDTIGLSDKIEVVNTGNHEYILSANTSDSVLTLINTENYRVRTIENIKEYWLHEQSAIAVLRQQTKEGQDVLIYYNLDNAKRRNIFQGKNISNLIFDRVGKSVAFFVEINGSKAIWHYRHGTKTAQFLLDDQTPPKSMRLSDGFWQFTEDGSQLLFSLVKQFPEYRDSAQAAEVWSYEDKMPYRRFKNENFQLSGRVYGENLSTVEINTKKVTRILNKDENVVWGIKNMGDFFIIESSDTSGKDISFNKAVGKSWYLLNIATREKNLIKAAAISNLLNVQISPDKKYVIAFDADKKTWICYNIKTKELKPFAEHITNRLSFYQETIRSQNGMPLAVLGWIQGTDHVIMQGTYDLWEVSLSNKTNPINLTGNSLKERVVYTLALRPENGVIHQNENLYVYSQDLNTRVNTFYLLNVGRHQLKQLHSGDFYWATLYSEVGARDLKKAKNAEAFLFIENRVDRSGNYAFATDFKTITKISEIYPEKVYNWMTSELLSYKDQHGDDCQAVLYKPENFDDRKKYPVIFVIYQEQSYGLHKHISPDWGGSSINIPYLVSNGYLVCKPDIYIAKGKIGEYAKKSVLAAVNHLAKYSWVDSTKFALTGHSLGGFETNYIITRTNRFAAAIASAGGSSMINTYNDTWGDGSEKKAYVMYGPPWMGSGMDSQTEAYVENSPILHSRSIETPLMLIHGEEDPNVPFYHSAQFFMQLRSMGKKVWLVAYPNEGHAIGNENNKKDCNYKIKSFLDYYLRGFEKPFWMIKHINF